MSAQIFRFDPVELPPVAEELRREVRAFLAEELAGQPPRSDTWNIFSPEFSQKLGQRGWIGMTWPKRWGGQEKSPLERYVLLEELLAAGAPVGAHWVADRQSGPQILKFGTDAQRAFYLPKIATGECYFCIGMSEPDAGSDLAAIRTRAVPADGGWIVNGTKLWTSHAHRCHYMILLCRTSPQTDKRHQGMTQFIVDLSQPGVTARPIANISGERHFNEVVFTDHFVPKEAVVGTVDDGWRQVMNELAMERSGPERFLSAFTLLVELVRIVGPDPSERAAAAIGQLVAHLHTLRRMSLSVAGMLQAGEVPDLEAAVVKDLGTVIEQQIPEQARAILECQPDMSANDPFTALLARTILYAPSFSIRGGTREILRGIIARGLGLR